jgi:hypothetical protein
VNLLKYLEAFLESKTTTFGMRLARAVKKSHMCVLYDHTATKKGRPKPPFLDIRISLGLLEF